MLRPRLIWAEIPALCCYSKTSHKIICNEHQFNFEMKGKKHQQPGFFLSFVFFSLDDTKEQN